LIPQHPPRCRGGAQIARAVDILIGNFGSDTLLGGKGDDMFLGDNPNGAPDPGTFDVCNGQQGTDLAVIGTCEHEGQMEGDTPFPEG
jgi:hypothetical protein